MDHADEPAMDQYSDITQATVPSSLALVPQAILRALHLA
jgi:hypothetical protein